MSQRYSRIAQYSAPSRPTPWRNIGRTRAAFGRLRANCGRHRGQFGPAPARFRSMFVEIGPNLPDSARSWPNSARIRPSCGVSGGFCKSWTASREFARSFRIASWPTHRRSMHTLETHACVRKFCQHWLEVRRTPKGLDCRSPHNKLCTCGPSSARFHEGAVCWTLQRPLLRRICECRPICISCCGAYMSRGPRLPPATLAPDRLSTGSVGPSKDASSRMGRS